MPEGGDDLLRNLARAIRPDRPLPMYAQVEEILERYMDQRQMQPGERFPGEFDLMAAFGLSRATVRQAIERLVDKGRLVRERGKGTFVSAPKVAGELPFLMSLTDEMARRGIKLRGEVIRAAWVVPEPDAQEALRVAPGEKVLEVERVRWAEELPLFHSISYLPAWTGLRPDDPLDGSLYHLMRERSGIRPGTGTLIIEAGAARAAEARRLHMKAGHPVLRNRRVIYDTSGRAIEYVRGTFPADRYQHRLTIVSQEGGDPGPGPT